MREDRTYQERKATKNPDQEKKNVRPYLLKGLRMGTERAFLLTGLTSGASQRCDALNPIPILKVVEVVAKSHVCDRVSLPRVVVVVLVKRFQFPIYLKMRLSEDAS